MPLNPTSNRRIVSRALSTKRTVTRAFGGLTIATGGGGGGGTFAQVQKIVYPSTASVSPQVVTFTSPPTLGNLCIWAVTSDNAVPTPLGLSLANSKIVSTGTYIFFRVNGAAESSTVNFALAGGTGAGFSCVAFEYSGMAIVLPVDLAPAGVTYTGASGPDTGTTGTLGQANELAIAIFSTNANTSATATWGNSIGTFIDEGGLASTGSTPNVKAFVASCKTTTTAALTAALTPSANITGEAVIATFKITNP